MAFSSSNRQPKKELKTIHYLYFYIPQHFPPSHELDPHFAYVNNLNVNVKFSRTLHRKFYLILYIKHAELFFDIIKENFNSTSTFFFFSLFSPNSSFSHQLFLNNIPSFIHIFAFTLPLCIYFMPSCNATRHLMQMNIERNSILFFLKHGLFHLRGHSSHVYQI